MFHPARLKIIILIQNICVKILSFQKLTTGIGFEPRKFGLIFCIELNYIESFDWF